MDIQTQFSKFATSYSQKNIIQKKIIQKYSKLLDNRSILDLGCGNGSLLCYTTPKEYIGIDFSQNMLSIHPNKNVFCFDFNTNECWEFIKNQNFDILVSFSALSMTCSKGHKVSSKSKDTALILIYFFWS